MPFRVHGCATAMDGGSADNAGSIYLPRAASNRLICLFNCILFDWMGILGSANGASLHRSTGSRCAWPE